MSKIDLIPTLILTACILYNLIIDNSEVDNITDDNIEEEDNVPAAEINDERNLVAEQKINYIATRYYINKNPVCH